MFLEKKRPENKIENVNSVSQEAEKEIDQESFKPEAGGEVENTRDSLSSFKLMAWTPSGSITVLECIAERKIVERIKKEVGEKGVIEVRGYLRNSSFGLEIIIKVVGFSKVDLDFDKIDKKSSNQVRLLGKIINDLYPRKNKWGGEILTFKLTVPREGVRLPLFYCRIEDRTDIGEEPLIPKLKEKLKKSDIAILEGFLQTKKEEVVRKDGKTGNEWISSVNCYGFTFLESDLTDTFSPLDNLTRVFKEVKERKAFKEVKSEPEEKA